MQVPASPQNTGAFASLSKAEKDKRLDAMVALWQRETERHLQNADTSTFLTSLGLDEYRYSVWLRFPEWERAAVLAQVVALKSVQEAEPPTPMLYTLWRPDPLLHKLPDWKLHLPEETVFNISMRITPGGLGEGAKWAVVMPREMIPRYKPGWPTQQSWVDWTRSFDWISLGTGFIRALLDAL